MWNAADRTGKAAPVLIVGSVALDTVETPLGREENALGGAAVYASVAASLFAPVNLVGVVGADFPREHLSFLTARGIDLRGLQVVEGRTFRWSGSYDYDLNQAHTRSTELNVFEDFHPRLPDTYRDAGFVFLANIDPDLQLEVLAQVRSPRLVVCDTMNFWIEGKPNQLREVIRRADIVFMNDAEARQFCGTFSLPRAARELMALGPTAVIIKKGEHGALLFTRASHFSAPSYPMEQVVDPTGAGDTFAGGFVGYVAGTGDISEGSLRKATVYGSVVASLNIEDFSINRLRRLTPEDVSRRYAEFKSIAFFEAMESA
ncbi:MAG: sugar kinase [Armatimonadetes bacterium]|nr:sugar kinase [Armatimonadota bacterium]